jgi:putative transcriptional regulator
MGEALDETFLDETFPDRLIDWKAALASGRCDPALALLVETAAHLRGAGDSVSVSVSAFCLETEAPCALSEGALDAVWARIDGAESVSPSSVPPRTLRYSELIRLPDQLVSRIRDAEAGPGWGTPAPGIRRLALTMASHARVEVLRIAAGVSVPRHTHSGFEHTLCLSGGFSDGRGSYGPGDVSSADEALTHQPVADADGPCFVLTVSHGDPRFTGLLGLLQSVVGAR